MPCSLAKGVWQGVWHYGVHQIQIVPLLSAYAERIRVFAFHIDIPLRRQTTTTKDSILNPTRQTYRLYRAALRSLHHSA